MCTRPNSWFDETKHCDAQKQAYLCWITADRRNCTQHTHNSSEYAGQLSPPFANDISAHPIHTTQFLCGHRYASEVSKVPKMLPFAITVNPWTCTFVLHPCMAHTSTSTTAHCGNFPSRGSRLKISRIK